MSSTELFKGLDTLILDQPQAINLEDFNKPVVDPAKPDSTETATDATVAATTAKPADKDANFIDPNDFFNRVKEAATDADDATDTDTDGEPAKPAEETKPEDALKTWAEYFKDNELLVDTDLDKFDGSIEALVAAFQKREQRVGIEMVDDYKSQLPAELKFLAENWEEGVPLNELINIRSNQIKYSNVTDEKLEDSLDTQKTVYTDYLRKTTKYSESKIEKEVARLVDLDEIKDESKEALKELKKFEAEAEDTLKRETAKQKAIRLEENAKAIKQYDKVVKETKEVIPGLKFTEKEQLEVFNKIINPIGINGYGEPVSYIANLRSEDPYKFDTIVTYLATVTKDFKDFSKILKVGETKAVKGLEHVLSTPAPKSAKDNIKTNSKQSLMELLEKNKGVFNK